MGLFFDSTGFRNEQNKGITHIRKATSSNLISFVAHDVISLGGDKDAQKQLLNQFAKRMKQRYPTIIITKKSPKPIHSYKPFYGMNEIQAFEALKKVAEENGYTLSMEAKRLFRAMCHLIIYSNRPLSLDSLLYVCENKSHFDERTVSHLGIDEEKKEEIIATLSYDKRWFNEIKEHLDLVRLAFGGQWDAQVNNNAFSIMSLFKNNSKGLLIIESPDSYSKEFFTFIAQEIECCGREVCVILDSVDVQSSTFKNLLTREGSAVHFGIFGKNVMGMFRNDDESFNNIVSHVDTVIAFQQKGRQAAALSMEFGIYGKETVTWQTGKGRSGLLSNRSSGKTVSETDAPKVSEREFENLNQGAYVLKRDPDCLYKIDRVVF